jgi:hypothetical protein
LVRNVAITINLLPPVFIPWCFTRHNPPVAWEPAAGIAQVKSDARRRGMRRVIRPPSRKIDSTFSDASVSSPASVSASQPAASH